MGLFDVVSSSDTPKGINIKEEKLWKIHNWLKENSDTSYPSLIEISDDTGLRPQEINEAVKVMDIGRWNENSNSNIRVVNPAAFNEKELKEPSEDMLQ